MHWKLIKWICNAGCKAIPLQCLLKKTLLYNKINNTDIIIFIILSIIFACQLVSSEIGSQNHTCYVSVFHY